MGIGDFVGKAWSYTPMGMAGHAYMENQRRQQRAPGEAADVMAGWGQQAMDQQQGQYDQTRADMMPWMQSGQQALGQMGYGLGIGGDPYQNMQGGRQDALTSEKRGRKAARRGQQGPVDASGQSLTGYGTRFNAPEFQYDASQYQMPGKFNASDYGIGEAPGAFDESKYQGPGAFDPSQYKLPGQFDASQYEMPGKFEFGMDDYQESPYAAFLQKEGQRGIERSAAAAGGLASGATMAGLQERAMGISGRDYGDQYNRALGTHQQNLGQALGERAFGYGQHLDEYGQALGERGFGYGQHADEVARNERERAFGYGQHGDEVGRYERDRGFGYGQYGDEYNQALGERNWGYGQAVDQYNRGLGAADTEYNRLANMAGQGQVQSQQMGQLGMGHAGQMGNLMTGMGNTYGGAIMGQAQAQQHQMDQLMNLGGQLGGAAVGSMTGLPPGMGGGGGRSSVPTQTPYTQGYFGPPSV